MKNIKEADLKGKRVFVRVDFNVPMKDSRITDNNRIKAAIPTIKYLLDNNCTIILGTHLGRPEGKAKPEFSTLPLARELAKLLPHKVIATDYVIGPEVFQLAQGMVAGDILLLGNLRFNRGEELNDSKFASELAKLAEIYVNDAFAVCHRDAASVSAITHYLKSYAGLLLESEINNLSVLLKKPKRPFVLVVGGAKVKDKAGVITNLIKSVDKVLIGGAVGNTFLAATGAEVSESIIDQGMLYDCRIMIQKHRKQIEIPLDCVRQKMKNGDFRILDIGPETVRKYCKEIRSAKTIFWNGNLGLTEDDRYVMGTREVAKAVKASNGTTIVAGGDTVGFLDAYGLADHLTFVSTGGGAALEFLAGKKLPGIAALE